MLGNSVLEYLFIRACIILLRLVAPTSIGYLVLSALLKKFLLPTWITLIAVFEACFYLFVYLPRCRRLQAPPTYSPVPLTKIQRQATFAKCSAAVEDAHPNDPPYPSGWFLPNTSSLPKRQDIYEWLLWALFYPNTQEKLTRECRDELEGYIETIEELLGMKFEEGKTMGLTSMRVNLDRVVSLHRPLIWYFIVALVDSYTSITLYLLGFRHYSPPEWFQSFPPRPILFFLSRQTPPGVSIPYWHRPHRSNTKHPLVLLHAIGIGTYPYIPIFRMLGTTEPDVGILIPEILQISMHMTPHLIPPRPEMLAMLGKILDSVGSADARLKDRSSKRDRSQNVSRSRKHLVNNSHSEAESNPPRTAWNDIVLVSHSFGTFIAGWIVRDYLDSVEDPTRSTVLHTRIAHLVFIDPIPILLSHHGVAHSFVYRNPWTVTPHNISPSQIIPKPARYSRPSAWQLWYFASRDADIARTLGRAFFWTEGGVWREDLEVFMRDTTNGSNGAASADSGVDVSLRVGTSGNQSGKDYRRKRNVAVVLAGNDQIVPAEAVRRHLTREKEIKSYWAGSLEGKGKSVESGVLEVFLYQELDHATVLDSAKTRRDLVDLLSRFVRDK